MDSTLLWQKRNKERLNEYQRKLYKRNKEFDVRKMWETKLDVKFRFGKQQAIKREKEWTLSLKEYTTLVNQGCHYCGQLLVGKEMGHSLDRIDNSKGYTLDNVLPCCGECNRLRGRRLTVEETELLIHTLIEFRSRQ